MKRADSRALVAVLLGVVAGLAALVSPWLAAGVCLVVAFALVVVGGALGALTELAWLATGFLAPMNGLRAASFVALSDVALVAAAGLTVAAAVVERRSIGFRLPNRRLLLGLGLIVTGGLLGSVFASSPANSLIVMAKFVLATVGSLALFGLWSATPFRLRRFCWAWLTGAAVSAVWAASGRSPEVVGRPQGLTTHPNHMGLVCVLGVGLAMGLSASAVNPRERVAAGVALVPLVWGVGLSGSRAALIGTVAVFVVWSAMSCRWRLLVEGFAVVALIVLGLSLGVVHLPGTNSVHRLIGDSTSAGSDAARVQHLQAGINQYENHPLTGGGFEFSQDAHDIYLQVLASGGPIALAGLTVAAGTVVGLGVALARRLRHAGIDRRLLLPLAMTAGYVGYLTTAVFQNILWDRYLWLFIAAALGLAAEIDAGNRVGDRPTVPDDLSDAVGGPPGAIRSR